jgi:hypothetical protein
MYSSLLGIATEKRKIEEKYKEDRWWDERKKELHDVCTFSLSLSFEAFSFECSVGLYRCTSSPTLKLQSSGLKCSFVLVPSLLPLLLLLEGEEVPTALDLLSVITQRPKSPEHY